jgi:phage terminase large subunit
MTSIELLQDIAYQNHIEKVSPKLEVFRNTSIGGSCPDHIRIKGCRGGRGAGAKSYSLTSLICQRANYESGLRIGCFREIQETLEESVYALIEDRVHYLRYNKWKFTDKYINTPTGSHFIFRGLKDLRASRNVKGLANFDIFFIEEAASITMESWNFLMPTLMRNPGSELWFCYNPEEEIDPVTEKIWNRNRSDALCIELQPGPEDNPWWNDGLQTEMEEDFKFDPDEAEHIWLGQPRKQGLNAAIARAKIRGAMDRNIEPEGQIVVGCDPADFGDDHTEIYIRKGLKTIDHRTVKHYDGIQIAATISEMIKGDPSIPINLDTTGIGVSTRDQLKALGLKVNCYNFAESASDSDKYPNITSELWFNFPVDEADIPDDPELMRQLSGRKYKYDSRGRRQIESKKDFKERYKKSPDKADAILLCYMRPDKLIISDKTREQLRNRRKR